MKHYVALTFDFDALAVWINSFKATNTSMVSRGEFGRIGIERILEVLDRHDIRATFFVPGHSALAYPESVRAIAAAGHEIGHHGFVHERVTELDPDEERLVLERGFEALEEVAGVRPVGYRSPSWEFTEHTLPLLLEHGFAYDSSLMGTDFTPYWPRAGDSFTTDGPYVFGTEVPIVELPVSWQLSDFPQFEYVRGLIQMMKPPSEVYETWWDEYRYFVDRLPGGCYTLTLHPEAIGRGSRLMMLERLIAAMKGHGEPVFATLAHVAETWRREQPAALPTAGAATGDEDR